LHRRRCAVPNPSSPAHRISRFPLIRTQIVRKPVRDGSPRCCPRASQ
jgi:hypothetical protein